MCGQSSEHWPGSEHLSQLPETSWMGLLGMGSFLVKKRYFSALSLSLSYSSWATSVSPPDLVLIFGSPDGDNSEVPLRRTQSQTSGKTCCCQLLLRGRECCRKAGGTKCLCVSCLQRKIKGYKEQTCFLRKSAPKVPWTCVIFLLPQCD